MNSKPRIPVPLFTTVAAILLFAQVAAAQSPGLPIEPNDYGVDSVNYLMIPATEFVPSESTTGFTKPFLTLQRTGGGSSEFTHGLNLPAGAFLQSVTAYVQDTSMAEGVTLRLCKLVATPGTGTTQNIFCDGIFGTALPVSTSGIPGNTALVMNVNATVTPLQIRFGTTYEVFYVILVHLGATDSSNGFLGVRVAWKRQMSPDPATATFTDVPVGHPLHRFVEALVASGITGGCGGGNYCPDAPITRGQMAVFLAAALGLHWAP